MKDLGKSQELVEKSKGKVRKESGKSNKTFRKDFKNIWPN